MATLNRNFREGARGRGIPMHEAPLSAEERLCFSCPLIDCMEDSPRCPIRASRIAAQIQRATERRINRLADQLTAGAPAS